MAFMALSVFVIIVLPAFLITVVVVTCYSVHYIFNYLANLIHKSAVVVAIVIALAIVVLIFHVNFTSISRMRRSGNIILI
ncbi:hypothetical protein DRW41_16645 [Neobacillus piezotolerans]|uniref:Uncharacterized protein n=1 Tax=Neobacillus piezotolerans TaxID=2259171 RepID=A0A3D8GNL7_9BACI|nr:hypothetical protein DRW41_16645 [Neobacillus piezotolerans]